MGISVGMAKIVTSLYALHLGAGPAQLGLINSGGMIGLLVMSLPIGYLVDHLGPQRLFVTGSVLGGLAYVLMPWAASPWLLLMATTAVGFFMPLRFVSLNTVFFAQIREMGEGRAGWSRAIHMSGMFLIGPGLGALLVSTMGFQFSWWWIAASFALTVAVSPLVMGARHTAQPTTGQTAPAHSKPITWRGPNGLAADLRGLLKDAELREINLIDFVGQGATAYTTTFIIVIALNSFGLSTGEASALVTGWGAAFIVTLFFGGLLSQRIGERSSVMLGIAVVALALVGLGLASRPAWLWPGVLLQGLGAALIQSVNLSRLARAGSRMGQGRVSGLNLLIAPLGGLLGSSVGGLLGQQLGLQAGFFCFLPGYLWLAAWQWRRSRSPNGWRNNPVCP